jgi:phasin
MFDKPTMEIPPQIREMAEKNVAQTKDALNQFMTMAREAQEMMMKSQGEAMKSALDIQTKAMGYAQRNVEEGFRLASDLAKARDVKEYTDIQTRYAQTQALTYTQQAQDLGRLVAEVAQKATPPMPKK